MLEQLIDTWRINHRATMILLEEISDGGMAATLSTRGGRDVARQFGHLHSVRLSRFPPRSPHLPADLIKFAKGETPDRPRLVAALEQSAEAVESLIRRSWEVEGGRVPGFPRGLIPFVGYLIAHEAHHRGSILLTLKQTKHTLNDRLRWGIWDWNRI